ncbi:MAG: preprotein translocase subunit SecA [Phycisphaeraceae bacterium]
MVVQKISSTLSKVFGSRNDRLIKRYNQRVEAINALEDEVSNLTDAQLREKTAEFRRRGEEGETIKQMLPEIMAVAREAMDRFVGIRNVLNPEYKFDPQKLSPDMAKLYDIAKAKADALGPEAVQGGMPAPGYLQVEFPVELYNAVREVYDVSRPPFRCRPFDVQLIGGMVLGEGKIAEMRTGEGKTIVAPLACYVACCDSLTCHVVTVNDYLVQRDRDWVFPFYYGLGLTVGATHPHHEFDKQVAEYQKTPGHPLFQKELSGREAFTAAQDLKKEAYGCDVLYATNSELGFDYLRDNMKERVEDQVQKRRDFVIIDEVDSILIDEARTPLIISGPKFAEDNKPPYELADTLARHLMDMQKPWQDVDDKVNAKLVEIKRLEGDIRNTRDKSKVGPMREQIKKLTAEQQQLEIERDEHIQYFEVEREKKAAHLTHDGVAEAQKKAGIGSFYVGQNMEMPHLLENALRAHAIYTNNKEYVVYNGEIVIVDEFTGRMMIGRQWSDGLHQAIECKEKVKIKDETQTLATVTIQNFFKLYKRLAGMTGTAITEATEFHEIYALDVVAVPTNRPIARVDRNDLIFPSAKDKWESILDEIKRMHDVGRPVLVGTTSVETSEMISQMLTRKHGIKHEVLNAKQHEREGNIVEDAGRLGSVMIATNMAGRGTDIKLRPIDRDELVKHWQKRGLLPAGAKAEMSDDELVGQGYRHLAQQQLGIKRKEADGMSDQQLKLKLLRHWCVVSGLVAEGKEGGLSEQECIDQLDRLGDYDQLRMGFYELHKLTIYDHTEALGGLHIVGTERHESRRIDNQLRGRSGRQGDNGSSRFFLSLEDPLMKMFAGEKTLALLSKAGFKEGDALESGMVSRAVERAQRKVEQMNYERRKNLLEYDEVMEHQRGDFYATRQAVLEGRGVEQMIFDYIAEAVEEAASDYLDKNYAREQVAEWARQQLEVSIDPAKLHLDDAEDLEKNIRKAAQDEVATIVDVTLGEYMSNDLPQEEWDLKALSDWAKTKFKANLPKNRLAQMNVDEVRAEIVAQGQEMLEDVDLTGLGKFLDPLLGAKDLAFWAETKFDIKLEPEKIVEMAKEKDGVDQVVESVLAEARALYARREIEYPVQFIMDVFEQGAKQDQQWAMDQLFNWSKQRFGYEDQDAFIQEINGKVLRDVLRERVEEWMKEGGKLEQLAKDKAQSIGDAPSLRSYMAERFGIELSEEEANEAEQGVAAREALIYRKGRELFRTELSTLEALVLRRILDQAWKDHLYEMDQLKSSINLRGYAERDPRIEYKKEGARTYQEMQSLVRDKVTERAFRAYLQPNVQLQDIWGKQMDASHPDPGGQRTPVGAARVSGQAQDGQPQRGASSGGDGDDDRPLTRKQRRAKAARKRKGM